MEPERNFGSESGSATLVHIQLISKELEIIYKHIVQFVSK